MTRLILAGLLLTTATLGGTMSVRAACAQGQVQCCCTTFSGGVCCASVTFCGGVIPGCMCRGY